MFVVTISSEKSRPTSLSSHLDETNEIEVRKTRKSKYMTRGLDNQSP